MKKIVRLTEDDLTRIVKRVILEQTSQTTGKTTGKPAPNRPSQKPTKPMPTTNLVGKEILLYSDSSQQKIFKKGKITEVKKFSDGRVAISLRVVGDVTNHYNSQIYFNCLESKKLSYYYKNNADEVTRVEVYCVPLLKILKNDYCMVGAGGILVPKVDLGANSSDTDVKIA
jgi:hypothetical protein